VYRHGLDETFLVERTPTSLNRRHWTVHEGPLCYQRETGFDRTIGWPVDSAMPEALAGET